MKIVVNLIIYTLIVMTWFGIIYGIVSNDAVLALIGVLCGFMGLLVVHIRHSYEENNYDTTN